MVGVVLALVVVLEVVLLLLLCFVVAPKEEGGMRLRDVPRDSICGEHSLLLQQCWSHDALLNFEPRLRCGGKGEKVSGLWLT